MSSASLGKAAELRVRKDLVANGYAIIQSHLSRGSSDILVGKPGVRLAVQVKRNLRSGGGIGVEEWNDLIDLAEAFDAVPVIAIAPSIAGIRYHRVTGRKDGSGRRQPWEPLVLDFAGLSR